jgi:predicted dehydrogenase
MKFLIAGFGSIGRRHFRNLRALGEEEIIFLRSGKSTLPDGDIDGFKVVTDLEAALEQKPDGVIVSNPTSLHLDAAIPAAEMGSHLLIEKPISHSMERIEELRTAVQRGGGQVLVGYQFRHHPSFRKIARLLEQGAIGRPMSVRAQWGEYLPSWHPWEDYRRSYSARKDLGGGVILTLCHPFDYLRWFLGEVEEVWAFADQVSDLELSVEDMVEVGIRFCNGALGSVHLNYHQRPTVHRLEITGTEGTIRWDNSSDSVSWFTSHTSEGEEGGSWQSFSPPSEFERNTLFMVEMDHFLAVVRGEAEPLCTLDDGIRALEIALAAYQSAQDAKRVKLIGAEGCF